MAVATPARADSPPATPLPLDLTWDVAVGCPEAPYVVRRVEQILEGPPLAKNIVIAKAKIRRPDGATRFELRLTIRTAEVEESRTIVSASCSALAEASAVVIALAINPSKETPLEPAEPGASSNAAPAAPETPRPAPPPSAPPRPPPRPVTPLRYRYAVGLGASLDAGTLPKLGAGMLASASVRVDRIRLGLLSTLWFRQEPTFDASGQAGAAFDMIDVGAFGGYLVPVGAFAFGPVVNLEATFVKVRGFGIRAPRAFGTQWLTAVVGGRAEVQLATWLGLFARVDAVFPVAAPTFTLGSASSSISLHEPALPGARLSFGTEIVLP
jgi:hypothetical protein